MGRLNGIYGAENAMDAEKYLGRMIFYGNSIEEAESGKYVGFLRKIISRTKVPVLKPFSIGVAGSTEWFPFIRKYKQEWDHRELKKVTEDIPDESKHPLMDMAKGSIPMTAEGMEVFNPSEASKQVLQKKFSCLGSFEKEQGKPQGEFGGTVKASTNWTIPQKWLSSYSDIYGSLPECARDLFEAPTVPYGKGHETDTSKYRAFKTFKEFRSSVAGRSLWGIRTKNLSRRGEVYVKWSNYTAVNGKLTEIFVSVPHNGLTSVAHCFHPKDLYDMWKSGILYAVGIEGADSGAPFGIRI